MKWCGLNSFCTQQAKVRIFYATMSEVSCSSFSNFQWMSFVFLGAQSTNNVMGYMTRDVLLGTDVWGDESASSESGVA